MTKAELQELLKFAKTTEQRKACLDAYRKQVIETVPARERYRQMDRFLRVVQKLFVKG